MVYIIIAVIVFVLFFVLYKFYKAHSFTIKWIVYFALFFKVNYTILHTILVDLYYDDYVYSDAQKPKDLTLGEVGVRAGVFAVVYVLIKLFTRNDDTNEAMSKKTWIFAVIAAGIDITAQLAIFYDNHLCRIIFYSAIAILVLAGILSLAWAFILSVLIPFVINIYESITYSMRVKKHVYRYVTDRINGNNSNEDMSVNSFLLNKKTKKLLSENRITSNGKEKLSSRNYILWVYGSFVKEKFVSALKMETKSRQSMGNVTAIYFYENFNAFLPYFFESDTSDETDNESFIETVSSIIGGEYCYIPGLAFCEESIVYDANSRIIDFIKSNPQLSDTMFSEDYLCECMYNSGYLNGYITEKDMNMYSEDEYAFVLIDLYSAFENAVLDYCIENNKVSIIPDNNDENESNFLFNHENEQGIIEEEYGEQFEQHRVALDEELTPEQEDELAGCPL